MTQNVGAIEYTIDVNTGSFVTEMNNVKKTNTEIGKSFEGVDKSVKQLDTELKKTSSSMAGMRNVAGNLGYQLQDIAIQAQMGTNAFTILGQQGSAVASAFGPTGAVFGAFIAIGAAIAGVVSSLDNGSEALERFNEVVTGLDDEKLAALSGDERVAALDLFNKKLDEQRKAYESTEEQINQLTEQLIRAEEVQSQVNTTTDRGKAQFAALGNEIYSLKQRIAELNPALIQQQNEIEETANKTKILTGETKVLTEEQQSQIDKTASVIEALRIEAATAAMTTKGKVLYRLETMKATEAQKEAAAAYLDTIENQKKLEEAERKAIQVKKQMQREAEQQRKQQEMDKKNAQQTVKGFGELNESPIDKINREETERLALIKEYQNQELINLEQFEHAKLAIETYAANERKKVNTATQQALFTSSSDFFGGMADLVGNFAGEQNAAYKAMFAVSKGFAIANAALQLQTAIANAMALPWPTNMPAIAQAVSLGGQIASSIGSLTYGGGRETGGPVSGSSFYQMGEGNKPEVLQTGAGMFVAPGDKGRVFNQNQLQQIGGGSQTVNLNVYTSGGESVRSEQDGKDINLFIGELANQMDNKSGRFHAALKRNYLLKENLS